MADLPQQLNVMNTESGHYEIFHLADLPFLQTYFLNQGGTVEDIEEMRYSPLYQYESNDEYDVLLYDCLKGICALGLVQKTINAITSLYIGEDIPDEMILFSPDLQKAMVRINTDVKEDGMYPNQLALIRYASYEARLSATLPGIFRNSADADSGL